MQPRTLLTRLVALLLAIGAIAGASASSSQAAVAFRACNNASGSAFWPYTVSFSKPAGTVAGDLIVIHAAVSAFYDAGGPPSGFTELHAASSPTAFTWYKIAGSSEPSSYTTGFMPATSTTQGVITSYSGVHPTIPIDGSAATTGSGNSVSLAGNGLAVPRSGDMRVSATMVGAGATATYPGMTKASCAYTSNPSVSVGYEANVAAGTLANRTANLSGSGAWASQTMLIRTAPTAPTVTAVSPGQGPTAGGTSVVISGTDFSGASAVRFGATNATSYTVDNDGQITAVAPAGTGTQSIRVTTAYGTSADTAADDYDYVPAPTVTNLSPSSGPASGGTSVTITGTNLTGASAVKFGGTDATSYTVVNSTTITATAPAGTGTVDVRVTTVGGTSANTSADDFTNVPAPTVTALSPSSGPQASGQAVVITGTNFTNASAVAFGGTGAVSFTVVNATTINATAPAGTGTVDVRVTTPGGQSANTAADNYTYVAQPTVTSVSPGSGPEVGGTSVTISGTNFIGVSGASAVQFGGSNASSYTVVNATTITATAPAGTGTADVRVTGTGGTSANTSADDYDYVPQPTVTNLSPSTGPVTGGTNVTITGTGFTGASAVRFGATNATGYTVVNSTTITATAPAGSGTVDVRVTTTGGQSANTSADDYVYIPAPTVTNVAPGSGPETGGTSVTITGTSFSGLSGASAVRFGATNAVSYTVVNATTITATAPAGTGTVDVRVTTASGTS
ncbi:MAG: IPT/TIG domain-containing protein, partial [Patulibacter minatonensis]